MVIWPLYAIELKANSQRCNPTIEREGVSLEDEVNMFQKLRQPNSQPLDYWKNKHRFPLLKAGAKVVLAIPVSSAAVERLFSAAGLLLSKLRKRMLPALVINSVYTKFADNMKIKEMVEKLPKLTELSLSETVDEQEIENLLNEHSDSEYECQNGNEW